MIAFDTEDDGHGNFFLCNFYDGKNHKTFELKNFPNEIMFRDCIIKYIYNQRENEFFAHNLEYDLSHIFNGVFLTCIDWYFSDRLLFAKIPKTRKTFIDSFNFSFSSLAAVGQQIGIPKFDIDIENLKFVYQADPETVIKYCRQDCLIVYEYIKSINDFLHDEFNFKRKNTIAGTSQNLFIKKFCDYKIDGINVDEELLKAYYGGRTELFQSGKIEKSIFALDVNSMYPSVMLKNKYPVDEFYITEKPVEKLYISQIRVTVKNDIDIPVLPYRKNKLLFPSGQFETYAAGPEIELAISENQIEKIEYLKTFNFRKTAYLFSDFINYFYDLRKIAKDKKDNFKSNFLKRVMNSCYGRFALHNNLKILTAITEENQYEIEPINDIAGYMELIIEGDKNKNYALALFITSYARIELYNLLQKVKKAGYNPLYCDTDSCFFYAPDKAMFDITQDLFKNFPINNEIGGLSLACYAGGEFKSLKEYMFTSYLDADSYKLKGIKKEYRQEYFNFESVQYDKPIKLRTSLKTGLKVNAWQPVRIEKKSEYDKREVFKDGSTKALEIKPLELIIKKPVKLKSRKQQIAATIIKDKMIRAKQDMLNHIIDMIDNKEIRPDEFLNDPDYYYDRQILGNYYNNVILRKAIEKFIKQEYYYE